MGCDETCLHRPLWMVSRYYHDTIEKRKQLVDIFIYHITSPSFKRPQRLVYHRSYNSAVAGLKLLGGGPPRAPNLCSIYIFWSLPNYLGSPGLLLLLLLLHSLINKVTSFFYLAELSDHWHLKKYIILKLLKKLSLDFQNNIKLNH